MGYKTMTTKLLRPNLTYREEYEALLASIFTGRGSHETPSMARRRNELMNALAAEAIARFPRPAFCVEYLQTDGSYIQSGCYKGLPREVAEQRLTRSGKPGRVVECGTR